MTTHEAWPSPPKPLNVCFVIDVCASLDWWSNPSRFSISSHAFDLRPPAAFVFEDEFEFLSHELLCSTSHEFLHSTQKEHGRAGFEPLTSDALTPKTTVPWSGRNTQQILNLPSSCSPEMNPKSLQNMTPWTTSSFLVQTQLPVGYSLSSNWIKQNETC